MRRVGRVHAVPRSYAMQREEGARRRPGRVAGSGSATTWGMGWLVCGALRAEPHAPEHGQARMAVRRLQPMDREDGLGAGGGAGSFLLSPTLPLKGGREKCAPTMPCKVGRWWWLRQASGVRGGRVSGRVRRDNADRAGTPCNVTRWWWAGPGSVAPGGRACGRGGTWRPFVGHRVALAYRSARFRPCPCRSGSPRRRGPARRGWRGSSVGPISASTRAW